MTEPNVQSIDDVECKIGGLGFKGTTVKMSLSFSVTPDAVHKIVPLLADASRLGSAYLTLKLAQTKLPEGEQLPLDGAFPAWEQLFDAAEVPVCQCPAVAGEDWPTIETVINDDGTTVEICHQGPCLIAAAKFSTLDFAATEDFNRAVVKAKGRKPVDLPFDEDA